jgi:hypothetical protein
MPRKKKVGRPLGRTKEKLLSVRVSKQMWDLLRQAAWENKRSLSREVEGRLDYTLGRYQKGGYGYDLPPHLRPLVDSFALSARYIEARFGRRWHENKFMNRELARVIGHVMVEFSYDADDAIPPKIIERAKMHPEGEKAYLAHPGDAEANAIILLLRTARGPQQWPPLSEWEHELWKIRRDLEHLERRRKK